MEIVITPENLAEIRLNAFFARVMGMFKRCRSFVHYNSSSPPPIDNNRMKPIPPTSLSEKKMDSSSSSGRIKTAKAFLPFTIEMSNISSYLDRAAFVEAFGRPTKVDDVSVTLAQKAKIVGSWMTKKLLKENMFLVYCPS